MAQRIYISKLIGDGLTAQTAYRAAWRDIIGDISQASGALDSVKHNVWIGTLDTTAAEHSLLIADNRVRRIPTNLLNRRLNTLTVNQRDAITEIFTFLGLRIDIFSGAAKVKDALIYITGRICWNPIKIAVEAIG